MSKNKPSDSSRTNKHVIPVTQDMNADLIDIQTSLRRISPQKPKRPIALLASDRIWESLEARKILQDDQNSNHEKMREIYRIFQIVDPDAPKPKK